MEPHISRLSSSKRPFPFNQDVNDAELARKRHKNDLRLKSTFDSIYDRYSRDFSEVGDEIDLRTGQVIVNNGHIESMRSELDVGTLVTGPKTTAQSGSSHTSGHNAGSFVLDDDDNYDMDQDEDEDEDELCTLMRTDEYEDEEEDVVRSTEELVQSPPETLDEQLDLREEAYQASSRGGQPFQTQQTPSAAIQQPTYQQHGLPVPQMPPISQYPQLETAVQAVTAAFQQSVMTLFNAYVPQTPPENAQGHPRAITPSQSTISRERNRLYSRRYDTNLLPKTQPIKKRSHFDQQSERRPGSYSVPSAKNSIPMSNYRREVNSTRLASPPETTSLWALPEIRPVGRPRRYHTTLPSNKAQKTTPQESYISKTGDESRSLSAIRSLNRPQTVVDRDELEDELAINGEVGITPIDVKSERGSTAPPHMETTPPLVGMKPSLHEEDDGLANPAVSNNIPPDPREEQPSCNSPLLEEKHSNGTMDESLILEHVSALPENDAPIRRGRGRPRKPDVQTSPSQSPQVRRGRGRPRTRPLLDEAREHDSVRKRPSYDWGPEKEQLLVDLIQNQHLAWKNVEESNYFPGIPITWLKSQYYKNYNTNKYLPRAAPKICGHCGATETCMWRRGPSNDRLCNSCYIYPRVHQGRLRPVEDPDELELRGPGEREDEYMIKAKEVMDSEDEQQDSEVDLL